jgi:8-hydroxy-5-deazaflavin:NADPH oxidoreductase
MGVECPVLTPTPRLISAAGLEPAYVGDATATATVDALLPLWFALVRQNGGDRKLALRIVR